MKDVYEKLAQIIPNDRILSNEPMSKHTTFKIGGKADVFIIVKNLEELAQILKLEQHTKITIIGNGSNVLVKDDGIRGIVLKLDFKEIEIKNGYIECGSGVLLEELLRFATENALTGMEFVAGIPGTVGGAIRMNAGAHGSSFGDYVVETTYVDLTGNVETLSNKEQQFAYRKSVFEAINGVIISTKIKLNNGDALKSKELIDTYRNQRKIQQKVGYPNAGSIFKRGNSYIAAELIDKAGLKGYKVGAAMISDIHAGFVVNTGGATATDVLKIIEHIKKVVYDKFEQNLELEIIVLGE